YRQNGRGEQRQRRDRPRTRRVEQLGAVSQAACEEREAEHEQTVSEHRADQRRLDDADEPSVERKQCDEQFGKVAERRLDRAGGSGSESASELFGGRPDQASEDREGKSGCHEPQHRVLIGVIERSGDRDQNRGDRDLDPLSPGHACPHRVTLPTGDAAPPKRVIRALQRPAGEADTQTVRQILPKRGVSFVRTRALVLLPTLAFAALLAAPASASQLVNRDVRNIQLAVNNKGEALVSYRTVRGQKQHVLAWGAVNARQPNRTLRHQRFKLDYAGGWRKYHKLYWMTFRNSCGAYDGPAIPWMVTGCKAPDGSYWALQKWQVQLPDLGFTPWTTGLRQWEL